MNHTIGFLGGGNMAQAMINGILASDFAADKIMVCDRNAPIRAQFDSKGVNTTTEAKHLIEFADAVVLAIKPQSFSATLPPLKQFFGETLIISVAAGITIDTISALTGSDNIIRAMPNTPALIQSGATGIYASDVVSDAHKQFAEEILATTGLVLWLEDEALIHAVTAVSGSAPAYFFYVMETMIAKGQQLGLSAAQAKQLTLQTALGAAKMAISSEDSPETLRAKVTSPNGTTHAAIESMKADKLDDIIARGMQACVDRSIEMAKEV